MLTKVHIVKAMVFLVVMYGYENWSIKKAEHQRIGALKLYCYRRPLKVSWTARRSNQSILSHCLWLFGLQHARLPCPSPTPWAYSNSCPSSQWCHPTISYSVVPFSSGPQSFPASGSFQMSQFFASSDQKDWSFSFNISLSNVYLGLISFRMDWLGVLTVQGTLKCLQHQS